MALLYLKRNGSELFTAFGSVTFYIINKGILYYKESLLFMPTTPILPAQCSPENLTAVDIVYKIRNRPIVYYRF